MTQTIKELIVLLEKYCAEIELVSFGLSPNPSGFCYELFDELPKNDMNRIDLLLSCLSESEERYLRKAYL